MAPEFFGTSIPKSYAILSHRWEADEVTYQDVTNSPETLAQKDGWAKIRQTCRVALECGHDYAWVDTCCIDKTSSAELSEAINSMFRWYAEAAVCFAFLSDVGTGQAFSESLWFTRGWTLQELVAPREILFFTRDWDFVGNRAQLRNVIHGRTGVSGKVLLHSSTPGPGPKSIRSLLASIPVAVRMSWAAGRVTTREEDRAYSLLRIFGVNMPMLYGEGSGAFLRLQEENMKQTTDLTLFAWTEVSRGLTDQKLKTYRGILAISPDGFRGSGNLKLDQDAKYNPELQVLGLECHVSADGSKQQIGVYLEDQGVGVFLRAKPQTLAKLPKGQSVSPRTIYIEKHVEGETAVEVVEMRSVSRRPIRFILSSSMEVKSAVPAPMWNEQKLMFIPDGDDSFTGDLEIMGALNPHGLDISVGKSSCTVM